MAFVFFPYVAQTKHAKNASFGVKFKHFSIICRFCVKQQLSKKRKDNQKGFAAFEESFEEEAVYLTLELIALRRHLAVVRQEPNDRVEHVTQSQRHQSPYWC